MFWQVADDEICGCPLTIQPLTDTEELCKNAKKHCTDHFKWERLRRAEIDADKVRQVKIILYQSFVTQLRFTSAIHAYACAKNLYTQNIVNYACCSKIATGYYSTRTL